LLKSRRQRHQKRSRQYESKQDNRENYEHHEHQLTILYSAIQCSQIEEHSNDILFMRFRNEEIQHSSHTEVMIKCLYHHYSSFNQEHVLTNLSRLKEDE
jgi:hypothetical protein